MRAHAALGEIGSALRAFEACRTHLVEELGVDPSAQTQALHLRLLRGESA
jgi:DNA-binding SARP family transcriptional activator